MERNSANHGDTTGREGTEVAKRVNTRLSPHSVSRAELDSDDYDDRLSVAEYLQRKMRREGVMASSAGGCFATTKPKSDCGSQ